MHNSHQQILGNPSTRGKEMVKEILQAIIDDLLPARRQINELFTNENTNLIHAASDTKKN